MDEFSLSGTPVFLAVVFGFIVWSALIPRLRALRPFLLGAAAMEALAVIGIYIEEAVNYLATTP